jgi:hypothetical protein
LTRKSAPIAEVKKNRSEKIAKEPQMLAQFLVVVLLVNRKIWGFLQVRNGRDVNLQVST